MPDEMIVDGRAIHDPVELQNSLTQLIDLMIGIYGEGYYPMLTVRRHWSTHNPVLSGEMARPVAYRWYLMRELEKLLKRGASLTVSAVRKKSDIHDPDLMSHLDESGWDITRKKLFLFAPERIELSMDRLEHYTGTRCEDFQRHILLTNYEMYMRLFKERFPNAIVSEKAGVQMPAAHYKREHNRGITIINIGVGPSNAKTCTDHLAVLRPDALIMVGHCGGVRNHQEIGDFVLATGYMREDHVLNHLLPIGVPVAPTFLLNRYLANAIEAAELVYRVGVVYTTADRNWELSAGRTAEALRLSRSVAIDMESATVAANGFRYRIPHATLLCISDKPLHGKPKLKGESQSFYAKSKQAHLNIAINALQNAMTDWPDGLPNTAIRGVDEPLMGGPEDDDLRQVWGS